MLVYLPSHNISPTAHRSAKQHRRNVSDDGGDGGGVGGGGGGEIVTANVETKVRHDYWKCMTMAYRYSDGKTMAYRY